ncbi:MAG TPA: hypothetical protein VFF30_05770 [Nitrososphaerales archaeon]|nr:hypothetical protein [Nitrososphaerales archaeon]
MRVGRFALGTAVVVGSFFSFLLGGLLFEEFFSRYAGVQVVAPSIVIDSFFIEFIIAIAVALGSLLLSRRRYGIDRWQVVLLGSITLSVIDGFIISTGVAFPIFSLQSFNYVFYGIFVLSIAGMVSSIRKTTKQGIIVDSLAYASGQYSSTSVTRMTKRTIFLWSALIGSVAGSFGLVTLNTAFGMYMEPPPPLLGQPLAYQSLQTCNRVPLEVCPPLVMNDIGLAAMDFTLCFLIAFIGASLILLALASSASHSQSVVKRNVVPIVLFIITILIVSLSLSGSISSGASLTQPHWPTPSGITFGLGNVSLYGGTATTPTSEGGAHVDIRVLNYHWTAQTITLTSILFKSSNGTTINPTVFQCQSATSCEVNSSFIAAPYSATVLSFYLGSPIQKGAQYSCNFSITSNLGGFISSFSPPTITAS